MKLSFAAWRKLVLVAVALLVAFLVVSDRRSASRQLSDLRLLYSTCARHSESLATQLEVINSHRKKVEKILDNFRASNKEAEKDFYVRIAHLEKENKALKEDLQQCKGGTNATAPKNDSASAVVAQLKEENREQQMEIERLREELRQARQAGNVSSVDASVRAEIRNGTSETELAVLKKPLPESKIAAAAAAPPAPQAPAAAAAAAENYMDENSVRFHRKAAAAEDAQFVRDHPLDRPARLPTILSQKALLKKLEERKKPPAERAKDEPDAAREDENVVDYQADAQPDHKDEDYKEMGH